MSKLEVFAAITYFISVYLTRKINIWCWIFSLIGVSTYFFVFLNHKDLGNMALQVVFFVQGIYGIIKWSRPEKHEVSHIDKKKYFKYIMIAIAFFYIIYYLLYFFHGSNIFLDAITTDLSLFGTYFIINKKVESWYVWIVADIFFITFFIITHMYPSAIVYFLFMIMAFLGLKHWKYIAKIAEIVVMKTVI